MIIFALMVFITQIIHIHPHKEKEFLEFEDFAIPLMSEYGGKMLHRIRPAKECFVDHLTDSFPYEVHILSFPSEQELTDFINDPRRQEFVHLKNESVQTTFMIKGKKFG